MSILGKFHEISFYGLITTIICLRTGKTSLTLLWEAKFHITDFSTFFLSFLFWACAVYIPIAVIGAFATKYSDGGEGLLFKSNNIVVIIFAHIAEEVLGLFLTPFWFLADFFRKRLGDDGKAADYITYLIELIFFAVGAILL